MTTLRPVPDPQRPVLIDPPCPDTLSDDWINGWQACRETLHSEWAAAYHRDTPPVVDFNWVLVGACALSGFIVGFVLALSAF